MKLFVFRDCSAKFMRGCMGIQAETLDEAISMALTEHTSTNHADDVDLVFEVNVMSEEKGTVFNEIEMV